MAHGSALIATSGLMAALVYAGLAAAAGDPNPKLVVERAALKIRATSQTLPNFTCVETITRVFFRPASTLRRPCAEVLWGRQHPTLDLVLHPWSTDRLRLDVTMTKQGELFSWAGARVFNDADVTRLVRDGPISTGAFGAFLIGVFQHDPAKFQFVRSLTADGGTLLEYAYQFPAADSNYKLRMPAAADSWYFTPYSGTFQVDAETYEVVRLEVSTPELPRAVDTCMMTTALDYSPVRIGRSEVMLTSEMRQRWVEPDGSEIENTTAFSSCREYTGESTVTYYSVDDGGSTDTGGRTQSSPEPIPAGLRMTFALASPIAADSAAAGDPFHARLTEDLRDSRHKRLAAKGAAVQGRLVHVERFFRPPRAVVTLRPDRVEIKGSMAPVAAIRDWRRELARSRERGRLPIDLPPRDSENSGTFAFSGEHVIVPAGFRSQWRTVKAAAN